MNDFEIEIPLATVVLIGLLIFMAGLIIGAAVA